MERELNISKKGNTNGVHISFYDEKPMLGRLVRLAALGVHKHEGELTEDVLRELWTEEMVSDSDIACLFNTTADRVHNIRKKYGINHSDCAKVCVDNIYSILSKECASVMRSVMRIAY